MATSYTNLKAGIGSDSYEPTTAIDDDGDLNFGGAGLNDEALVDDTEEEGPGSKMEAMEVAGPDEEPQAGGRLCWPSILSVQTYRPYFDVDTEDVQRRVMWPLTVSLNSYETFLSSELRGEDPKRRSDLYGPLWVATTLELEIAIVGNARSWLKHINDGVASSAWAVCVTR